MIQSLVDFFVNLLIYVVAFIAGNISGYYQKFNVYDWGKETIWPIVKNKGKVLVTSVQPWYLKAKNYISQQIWPYVNKKKTLVAEKVRHYEKGVLQNDQHDIKGEEE